MSVLEKTTKTHKHKVFATWYNDKGKPTDKYTFQEIWEEAGGIAHYLRVEQNLAKGDRVILCYSFGLQFFAAFLGCLRAGVVAVLIYPPNPANLTKSLPKMNKVTEDCGARFILLDTNVSRLMKLSLRSRSLWPKNVIFKVHSNIISRMKNKNKEVNLAHGFKDEEPVAPSDLAFLQYTSGSTGDPKGVMVSFHALKANVDAINVAARKECEKECINFEEIVSCSWLPPQYHDMGLIGGFLAPFAAGWTCHMFSPANFVQNPLLWLEVMSQNKVSYSLGPDFSYSLIARKFNEANKHGNLDLIKDLDLSSIICLQSGAEPLRKETHGLFSATFKNYGLRKDWFGALYGMAEMVVFACQVRELKLSKNYKSSNGSPLIAVGYKHDLPHHQQMKIVCPKTHEELNDNNAVGELWISAPSITAGYFGKPELTKEVFHARIDGYDEHFLRTGDLAFVEDDYLYICGRQKDLVIVNGVNHYPQDIEYAVQRASSAVRPGCVAAFSSNETGADGELEVVFEIRVEQERDSVNMLNVVNGDWSRTYTYCSC